jgi:N-acetylglucosamine malate deacetylase 1
LGVIERINLKFDDLQMIDDHMTRLIVAQQIRKYRPEIVLFPYHVDRHPDHEVV